MDIQNVSVRIGHIMSSARHSFGFEYDTTALFINNGEAMINYIHPNKRQVD